MNHRPNKSWQTAPGRVSKFATVSGCISLCPAWLSFALTPIVRYVRTIALAFGLTSVIGCAGQATHSIPTERRTVALSNYDSPTVTVICELRYYLVGHVTSLTTTNRLKVVRNVGTNLICSIAEPLRLLQAADTNLLWEIGGFVFQIVEPQDFAGQILTAHFDGPLASGDPFQAFALGKRYQMDVSQKFIGKTDFAMCY